MKPRTSGSSSASQAAASTRGRAQLAAIWAPILFALLIPFGIGFLHPAWIFPVSTVIDCLAHLLPLYLIARIILDWRFGRADISESICRYIRPLPPGLVYKTNLNLPSFPWITAMLIGLNALIFILVPRQDFAPFCFPPRGDFTTLDLLLSVFTSAFLHANFMHLFGNMLFLWAFGAALEPRIGSFRFFLLYFLCIAMSELFVFFMLVHQVIYLEPERIRMFHSIGASGTVSGVMGLFIIRCHFSKIAFCFPLFGVSFLSAPVRIQGLFMMCFFFAFDVAGSVFQYNLPFVRTNYWAHVGGYLAGFIAGYLMGFHKDAVKEFLLLKAQRFARNRLDAPRAVQAYHALLLFNREDETALAALFEMRRPYGCKNARLYFAQLTDLYIRQDASKAALFYIAHCPAYATAPSGTALLRIGAYFSEIYDFRRAKSCFQLAAAKKGPWQAKAMLSLGSTFEHLCRPLEAKETFSGILKFHDCPAFHREAALKIRDIERRL